MIFHLLNRCEVEPETDCLVLPIFEDRLDDINLYKLLEEQDRTAIKVIIHKGHITGKSGSHFYLPVPMSSYQSIMLLGLGRKTQYKTQYMRQAAGNAVDIFRDMKKDHLLLDLELYPHVGAEGFIEGIELGQYSFSRYKTNSQEPAKIKDVCIHLAEEKDLTLTQIHCDLAFKMAQNCNWSRDLGNIPADDLTPAKLATVCQDVSEETGAELRLIDEPEMHHLGMNAILAVSKGSDEAARLIELHYRHKDATKTIALIGKGITFDSGGLNLKSNEFMSNMKTDMCGAAAVLGAMKTVCAIAPAINLICIVPAAENMCGAAAMKPGDIVRAYNGKTIEVCNTDAEGRLILADALAYTAEKYNPDYIVDVATLTNSVKSALGQRYAGIMTESDELAKSLINTGDEINEPLWRLPLNDGFREDIQGKHADLSNASHDELGGASTAAAFLSEFCGRSQWAHIDVTGTCSALNGASYLKHGHVTGFGARLLSKWILNEAN